MILKSIVAGYFKLDGGAMFGVVPKRIWSKLMTSDDNNLCTWTMRCLYIEQNDRKILIDTGLGNKQDAKFYNYYEPSGDALIQEALQRQGIEADAITDVILTHLHFDHVGGALIKDKELILPTFRKAIYYVHEDQWENALIPNAREKASYLKENIMPLEPYLHFLKDIDGNILPGIDFIQVDGHSKGMILPLVTYQDNKKLLYTADLFPSVHHIPLPYIMSYDMLPLITLQEKIKVLDRCIHENIALYFEHDAYHEMATVGRSEPGKYFIHSTMSLDAWINE